MDELTPSRRPESICTETRASGNRSVLRDPLWAKKWSGMKSTKLPARSTKCPTRSDRARPAIHSTRS